MTGFVDTAAGRVPLVSTRLGWRDTVGSWRARWGFRRERYRVAPGLYGVGTPVPSSPVLVTANYKLTFDTLRKELGGLDAWILVLDTRGVNVWCAAGKGTFGTEELLARIDAVGLRELVTHQRLILPQLGATGVSAHEVRSRSGFGVLYGPVRAADIPAFVAAGCRKDRAMRRVRFGLRDRLVVVPAELTRLAPYAVGVYVLAALLGLVRTGGLALLGAARSVLPVWGAMLVGAVMVPVLLPILPGRPFSVKGLALGLAWSFGVCLVYRTSTSGTIGAFLLLPAISAFLAMGFTGSTTFTSLSGVKVEVRVATPLIAIAAAAGAVLWIIGALTGGST
jgi:hypothetical protein